MASHAPTTERRRRSPAPTRKFDWTDERRDTLRRLWAARSTSGQIARQLGGVSRDAVMGMINRMGLLGTGGSREVHPTLGEAKAMLKEVLGVEYDPASAGHDEMMVAIAGTMCGRDVDCISHCLRASKGHVERILQEFQDAHIWVAGSEIPDRWFAGAAGNVSLAMDCLVVAGAITRVRRDDGEWEYRSGAAPTD